MLAPALAALLLLCSSLSALAQSAVQVVPNPAPAGASLRATLVGLQPVCFAVNSFTVERNGATVTLRVQVGSGACGVPPPGYITLPIGSYGPGNYTLVYEGTIDGQPQPVLTTAFQVLAGPRTVPANRGEGLALLAFVLAAVGAAAVARRR